MKKIVVVDDSKYMCDIFIVKMEKLGYDWVIYNSGKMFWRDIKDGSVMGSDIVFMDVNLEEEGMGLELGRELKEMGYGGMLYFMSSDVNYKEEVEGMVKERGWRCVEFLIKPFRIADVLKLVEKE